MNDKRNIHNKLHIRLYVDFFVYSLHTHPHKRMKENYLWFGMWSNLLNCYKSYYVFLYRVIANPDTGISTTWLFWHRLRVCVISSNVLKILILNCPCIREFLPLRICSLWNLYFRYFVKFHFSNNIYVKTTIKCFWKKNAYKNKLNLAYLFFLIPR